MHKETVGSQKHDEQDVDIRRKHTRDEVRGQNLILHLFVIAHDR